MLLIGYILILIALVAMLILSIRKNTRLHWVVLFSTELVSMLVSFGLARYFDALPGYGFMPGLSYLEEVVASYGAMIVYGVTLLISIIFVIVRAGK